MIRPHTRSRRSLPEIPPAPATDSFAHCSSFPHRSPFTIHHSPFIPLPPSPFPSRFISTHKEFGEALISIAASIETGSGGAGEGGRGDLAPIKESGGGASFTPQEVATLVEHFDLNDDGEVDYDEFMDLIQPQSAAGYEGKHSGSGGGKK